MLSWQYGRWQFSLSTKQYIQGSRQEAAPKKKFSLSTKQYIQGSRQEAAPKKK